MLELKNVNFTYFSDQGETEALSNISFSVSEGEFVAILGPSGCGKTTILSLISGLLQPTKGQVLLQNKPIQILTNQTGYMFQKDHLFEWRNVQKNVLLGLEIQKRKAKKRFKKQWLQTNEPTKAKTFFAKIFVWHQQNKAFNKQFKQKFANEVAYANQLLQKYGLWDFRNHYPNQLSGGMRQRVALIRTLALNPSVLLLDEPFTALDYQTRLNLCDDVSKIIKTEHKTTILVTHDITEALSMASKIIVLTKRPASILNVHNMELDQTLTPLQRRESGAFLNHFDIIWKELQTNEKQTNKIK